MHFDYYLFIISKFAEVFAVHEGKRSVFGYFHTIEDAERAARDAGRDDLLQPRTSNTSGTVPQDSPATKKRPASKLMNLLNKKASHTPAKTGPVTDTSPDTPDLMALDNMASSSLGSSVLATTPCMLIFVRVMILLRGRSSEYGRALGWVLTMPGMDQYIASQSWTVLGNQAMKAMGD